MIDDRFNLGDDVYRRYSGREWCDTAGQLFHRAQFERELAARNLRPACGNCRFAYINPHYNQVDACRRRAPALLHLEGDKAHWPRVSHADLCGDWERATPHAAGLVAQPQEEQIMATKVPMKPKQKKGGGKKGKGGC